jgi:hypothetical protein
MLWTRDSEIVENTATLLRILGFGNLLNCLMWVPYQAQLAHGWTSLAIRMNIIAISFIVPTLIFSISYFGAPGAAWTWVTLNSGYVLIGAHFFFQRILMREKLRWYFEDILLPLGIGCFVSLLFSFYASSWKAYIGDLILVFIAFIFTVLAMLSFAPILRKIVINKLLRDK